MGILKDIFKPFIDEVNAIPENFKKAVGGKKNE